VAVIVVEETTVNEADVVPSLTEVAPVKFVPVIVTLAPGYARVGVKLVIVGAPPPLVVTVKFDTLVPVPFGVVTAMCPVVAPAGTVALMLVLELTVKVVATVPLNLTLVAPVKFVPVTDTFVPTGPLVGVNEDTVGGLPPPVVTVKLDALVPVPFGVVTAIGPLVAPLGTVALTLVLELTVKLAEVPLNVTAVAPVKFVPMIDTLVPTGPLVGLNEVTVGGLAPPEPYLSRQVEPSFDHSCCNQ
jgi:hypothetical protein